MGLSSRCQRCSRPGSTAIASALVATVGADARACSPSSRRRGDDPDREAGLLRAGPLARARPAQVSRVRLGPRVTASDWRFLHDQILAKLPDGEVRSTRITPFGVAYEVIVMIDGLNGRTAPIVTTWMVATDTPPRLTSTWVDIP